MEKQVSTLYPISGCTDKRKTIEISKVMKGALSESKSRSGEALFRSHEFHKKNLEKKVKQYRSEAKTEINSYESKKRNIAQRFTMIFGRHKATNETIYSYAKVITKAIEKTADQKEISLLKTHSNYRTGEPDQKIEDIEDTIANVDEENNKDVQKATHQCKTALDESTVERKSVFIQKGILLPIKTKYSRLNFQENVLEQEPEEKETQVSKELWPLEKEPYDKYIRKQKDRHEVLITRNILKKIMDNITAKDTLLKFQMKAILTDDPEEFVRNLTTIKTHPSEKSSNENTNKQFTNFISRLPSRALNTSGSLRTNRNLLPPFSSNSVKSTSGLLALKRSKTMPI